MYISVTHVHAVVTCVGSVTYVPCVCVHQCDTCACSGDMCMQRTVYLENYELTSKIRILGQFQQLNREISL